MKPHHWFKFFGSGRSTANGHWRLRVEQFERRDLLTIVAQFSDELAILDVAAHDDGDDVRASDALLARGEPGFTIHTQPAWPSSSRLSFSSAKSFRFM